MKATLVVCSFGVLAFDDNKLVDTLVFSKKPQIAAKIFHELETGNEVNNIERIINSLTGKGYDTFELENSKLADSVQKKLKVTATVDAQSAAGKLVRSKIGELAVESGFVNDLGKFETWMHDFAVETAKMRVKGAVEKRDIIVAQAIQTLDELEKTINMLMAHVREWYGIHFPELDRLLEKHETYARLVEELGNKEFFTAEKLESMDVPKPKAEAIAKVAERSMGADLAEIDLEQIRALCQNVTHLYKLRQNLENYIDSTMQEVAPNIRYLVGALLGARLIAVAGGLINLAKRPASTIQILGAEKALFRSMKTGTRPPKHGLIFQHTLIHDAKRWQRGKIARALAGKLAIAARADAFGGREIGAELKLSLDRRIDEIREKYDQPPPMPAPRMHHDRRDRPRRENWRRHRREG